METMFYQWRFNNNHFHETILSILSSIHFYSTVNFISDVLTMHWDDVFLSMTFKAYRRCFISDVLTKHGENQWHSKLRDDVKSVSVLQCMETTFYQWRSYSAWTGRCISDVPTLHRYDVLSVTFLESMDRTLYQWRSNNTGRRRFISDVITVHGDDVLSVTFQQ